MGNCANAKPSTAVITIEESPNAVRKSSFKQLSSGNQHQSSTSAKTCRCSSFMSNGQAINMKLATDEGNAIDLEEYLGTTSALLEARRTESDLTKEEVGAALHLYHELKRLLSIATRSGDYFLRPSSIKRQTKFQETFQDLQLEFDEAEKAVQRALSNPAAVQPLSRDILLHQVNDFFILDNSLRETTVSAERGHTLEEKHQIVEALADTGLEEVILGSFGSEIAVDCQIAEKWNSLGKSFDSTWGLSDCYDMKAYDDNEIWDHCKKFKEREPSEPHDKVEYYTPPANPRTMFSESDLELFERASKGFKADAFAGQPLPNVLKNYESDHGRVPFGLLMMAGYGVCNAVLEIDSSVETFDYRTYDLVDRCKFLIRWCKENLPRRQNVPEGQGSTARVLINLRDFSNYPRSEAGLANALRLVDELSRLPPEERPFGFMVEEPTGWLFPDEVAKLCRMIRLTMNRAGFLHGKLLVHAHWNFGLAEAVQLAALCNGADGIWAAVCKTGAQTGHACSTMTTVNLHRAGLARVVQQYDLGKMVKAARAVTEISTGQSCPSHEEIYGELAFDVSFFMTALPSYRYALSLLLKELGVSKRPIRVNELSPPTAVRQAMENYFGPSEQAGWDPAYVEQMCRVIRQQLLIGLSRDYNSAPGLGHLYSLVTRKPPSDHMLKTMTRKSAIADNHPTVLEFVQRWNRLCAKYEGDELPLHPAALSKSIMVWGTDHTVDPRRLSLPFEFFMADVLRNPILEPVPRQMKLQELSLLTNDTRQAQNKHIPEVHFYDMVLRLKLFIAEADSLGVLGQVDDFCIRRSHDFFLGDETLWLTQMRGSRPAAADRLFRRHIEFLPTIYAQKGNNAMVRSLKAASKRIDQKRRIRSNVVAELQHNFAAQPCSQFHSDDSNEMVKHKSEKQLSRTHLDMLKSLVSDKGTDTKAAIALVRDSEIWRQ